MKLSMWILKDYLSEFKPKSYIQNGELSFSNVRILSNDLPLQTKANVYLTRAADYISNEESKVICVHGEDILLLETEDLDLVFNRILDCFDWYNQWESACNDLIYQQGTLQEILDVSKDYFQDDICIADTGNFVINYLECHKKTSRTTAIQKKNLSFWKKMFADSVMPMENNLYIRKNLKLRTAHQTSTAYIADDLLPTILRPLFYQGTVWGAVIEANIFSGPSIEKKQTLDILGSMIERWININGIQKSRSEDFRKLFYDLFTTGDISLCKDIEKRLTNLLWNQDSAKVFTQIASTDSSTDMLPVLCFQLNKTEAFVAGIHGDYIFLLVNLEMIDSKQYEKDLRQLLRSSSCFAGVSYTFHNLEHIISQQQIAETALQYGDHQAGSLNNAQEYILTYLKTVMQKGSSIDYIHPAVHLLEEYDAVHNTELAETLYYFLLCGQNFAKTGEKMFLHRNTVQYRIEKAFELIGLEELSDKVLIHLFFSLCMIYTKDSLFDSPAAD